MINRMRRAPHCHVRVVCNVLMRLWSMCILFLSFRFIRFTDIVRYTRLLCFFSLILYFSVRFRIAIVQVKSGVSLFVHLLLCLYEPRFMI